MFRLVNLLVTLLLLAGCQAAKTGGFAIYLLAGDVRSSDLTLLDLNQLTLQPQPLISEADIVAYEQATHTITLTPTGYVRFQAIFPRPVRVDGIPFAVCLDKQPIYTGALWTPVSSLSFDGIVIMEPFGREQPVIQITLGYPGPDFSTGPDLRADQRVMERLRTAGKLK